MPWTKTNRMQGELQSVLAFWIHKPQWSSIIKSAQSYPYWIVSVQNYGDLCAFHILWTQKSNHNEILDTLSWKYLRHLTFSVVVWSVWAVWVRGRTEVCLTYWSARCGPKKPRGLVLCPTAWWQGVNAPDTTHIGQKAVESWLLSSPVACSEPSSCKTSGTSLSAAQCLKANGTSFARTRDVLLHCRASVIVS